MEQRIKLLFVIKVRFFFSVFEWQYKTGFTATKKTPILDASSCMHMRI